jgi:hypothetical protein
VTALADIEQLKSALNVRQGHFDEELAELYLEAASDQVQRYCERDFVADPSVPGEGQPEPAAVVRQIHTAGRRMVPIPDARRIDAVRADGTALGVDRWSLVRRGADPATAIVLTCDARVLELTGLFGWEKPPAAIVKATITLAARAYEERNARFADQIIDPVGGVTNYFRQLPASVHAELGLYRRVGLS